MVDGIRKAGLRTDADVHKLINWLREPQIGTRVNCKFEAHRSPFEFVSDVLLKRVNNYVVWANRSGSKSFMAGLVTWVASSFTERLETTILGGSFEQSEKSYKAMNDFWNSTGLEETYLKATPTRQRTEWLNGSVASVLTASTKSVRGAHPQRVIMDEIDEMDEEVYVAALSQPQSKHGITASLGRLSTNHKQGGMMDQALERARESGTAVYKWCVAGDTLVLTDKGEMAIRDMNGSEKVWTLEGFKALSFVGKTGYNKTLRVKTYAGRILELTHDHLVLAADGWKRADNLRPHEEVVVDMPDMRRQEASSGSALPDLFHEDPSGGSPEAGDRRAGKRNETVQRPAMQGPDIFSGHQGENGRRTTPKVQGVAALEQRPAMNGSREGEHQEGQTEERADTQNVALVSGKKALRDDEFNRGKLGTGKDTRLVADGRFHPGAQGLHRSERRLLALLAEKQGQRQTKDGLAEEARLSASRHHGDRDEGRVGYPSQTYGLDRIVEIAVVPEIDVYDLTVKDGPPHFFANGILVHNCVWECLKACQDYACSTCKLTSYCPGQHMKNADGYYEVGDFVQKLFDLSDQTLQVEWFCNKVGRDDLVYGSQYDEAVNSPLDLPEFNPKKRVKLSMDWGGTNPFSVGAWQDWTREKIGWVRFDEIYQGNTTNQRIIAEAKKKRWWKNVDEMVADPARADLIAEWRETGISVYGADNAVDAGIEATRDALHPILGKPKIYVARTCRMWRFEAAAYYEKHGKPVKENDHAMDETRYFVKRYVRPTSRVRVRRI